MNTEIAETEVMPSSALESITRGEIDMQIATAHRYPRSMAKFKQRALEMVSVDEDTAASCIYRRPVGKKKNDKTGKWEEEFAEGMSIRMAEIGAACYGNIRVGSMIVEQTDRRVICRGMCHDLESNVASTSECIESTVKSNGEPYSEGMRTVVAKACLSKAHRDAFFKVVPRAIFRAIEEQARMVAIGTTATLASRRQKTMDWINKLAIDPARVWVALGIAGPDEIGLDQLVTLTGLRTAIKDKEITVDDAFPSNRRESIPDPSKKTANPYAAPEPQQQPLTDEPAPKPQPDGEPPMESPVVVSEDTERSQLIDDIKATCAEQETTLATFGGKAKTALNLEAKTSLRDAPIETLRVIHANRMAIIAGTYQVGGEA